MKPTVLVADDDPALRTAISRGLMLEGYETIQVGNGRDALQALHDNDVALVVLDIMMPYINGLEVCRRMRQRGDKTPVLVLTARDQVSDRVEGLDAGADDYLVKPFALEELRARLRALHRRTILDAPEMEDALTFEDVTINTQTREAGRAGEALELTRTEFELLLLLMQNAGKVVTRDTILDRVWGYNSEHVSNSLEVFISYLRRKLEEDGQSRLIHTVRGVGYQLKVGR